MRALRGARRGAELAAALLALGAVVPAGAEPTRETSVSPPVSAAPLSDAPRIIVIASAGGDDHLWFVMRHGSLAASLGHVAVGMAPTEFQQGVPMQGRPTVIAAWGEQAFLLFPPRSAILPRQFLLSTAGRRNPASGLWVSIPAGRLELRPALPSEASVESMIVDPDGPLALFNGDEKLWRLEREQWVAIDLPDELANSRRRRLEPVSRGPSVLATSGVDEAWERWRFEEGGWTRRPLDIGASAEITPIGGPALAALVEHSGEGASRVRRIMSLPDDGPIVLTTLDASIPEGAAVVWFRGAPTLIDGADGKPQLRRIDPVTGEVEAPILLVPQRSLAAAWGHLPILAALVISLLMVVFFVRSLRDESVQKMPEGWEPLPFGLRLIGLAVDLVPGVLLAKFMLGVSWSSFAAVPWLVVDSTAALPTLVAPLLTVIIGGICEAAFGTTLGKRIVGGRVISMRAGALSIAPTATQTLARNLFKAVVLQMQLLAIFTLIHPLGQGVGETVSATAVVRRRPVAPAPAQA